MYEHFENIVKEAKKSSPKGLREMWQVPYDQWAKVEMARSLNQNVYNGISISIVITFMFLLVSTGNLILSSLAILSIGLVVVSLFATIRLAGWGMGVPESIGVVVFVGFAIDYVVHICHQYQQNPFKDRKNKVMHCYEQVGSTILNGALSTLVAGICLLFCRFVYLKKFGLLLVVTVVGSLFSSLVFYPALLHCIGPEGDRGQLSCRRRSRSK